MAEDKLGRRIQAIRNDVTKQVDAWLTDVMRNRSLASGLDDFVCDIRLAVLIL